ncbi:MAG TPA: methyltransferase domain-containing protein [Humibacter sp.]|nr:methyltransferase domain-containing protein [Humibacter sp.]
MDAEPNDLEDVRDVASRFDERASHYDDSQMHRELAARVAGFVHLDGVDRVLDVATGTGLVLRALPSSTERGLVGADVSPGMLDVARRAAPGAEFVLVDPEPPLPFADGSFDLITCVTGLHLMPNLPTALQDWRRLLTPSGRIVVATFSTSTRNPGHGSYPHRLSLIGTPEAMRDLAAPAGLRVARTELWTYAEPFDVCLLVELAHVA